MVSFMGISWFQLKKSNTSDDKASNSNSGKFFLSNNQIINSISNGDLRNAIEDFKLLPLNPSILEKLLIIGSQISYNENDFLIGIIPYEEYKNHRSRHTTALIKIALDYFN